MSKSGRTSINEIMGAKGEGAKEAELDFADLPGLLGEQMPELEFHTLGRVRLVRALEQRFGPNYRTIPGIRKILDKFDHEAKITLEHHIMKKKLARLGQGD